jgi:sec-independent protein translocase protein TatC
VRAAGDEPGEAPAGDDDAKASAGSDAETQFKTGLGSDPAFDAALASVSDMASDAAPAPAEEKRNELTKEDFVAPTIDWGDTGARDADAEDAAQEPVTFSAADLAGDAPGAVPPSSPTPTLAERAMAQSAADGFVPAAAAPPAPAPLSASSGEAPRASAGGLATLAPPPERQAEQVRSFLYPGEEELPDDVNMTIWEHLEELRDRALVSAGACTAAILLCFCFAKDLVIFLEAPVASEGVRFLQLGPGEYFFTTVKVAGYCGLLLGQTGLVSSKQMLSVWRYVVVGSVVAAAVLTPSTDPFTQMLLAVPLMSLYLGGAAAVGLVEKGRGELPEGGAR